MVRSLQPPWSSADSLSIKVLTQRMPSEVSVCPRGRPAAARPPSPSCHSRCCWLSCCSPPQQNSPAIPPDTSNTSCKKLLKYYGYPNKVLLFPEEGWARSASSSYWTLQPHWWCRTRCKVVEVSGTRRNKTRAKIVHSDKESICIVGSFNKGTTDPDFKLVLTCKVSVADFNMGYGLTGTLERGCKDSNTYQTTHFAVIRRRDYEK